MDNEDAQLLRELYSNENIRRQVETELRRTFLALGVWRALLAAVAAGLIVLAYLCPDDSYAQALAVGFAAGIALFLAVPLALTFAKQFRDDAVWLGVALAATAGVAGYYTQGVTRSLLVELCIGTLLVIALDIFIDKTLESLSAKQEEHLARLQETHRKIQGAEAVLDAKYAWNDYLGIPRPGEFGGLMISDEEFQASLPATTPPPE